MDAQVDPRSDGPKGRWRPVLIMFLVLAGFLLLLEHRAHLLGFPILLLLLACPLLHLFMHGSHGGHDGHARSEDDPHARHSDRGGAA